MGNKKSKIFVFEDSPDKLEAIKTMIKNSFPDALVRESTSEPEKLHLATLNLLEDLHCEINARKIDEEELKKSEAILEDIFQTVSEGIAYISPEGMILAVNSALEKIISTNKEFLVGRNIFDLNDELLLPENAVSINSIMKKIIDGKNDEIFRLENNGRVLEITSRVNRYTHHFTGLVRDITEQVRAEEKIILASKNWSRTFDAMSDSIAILDENKHIILVNQTFLDFFGYTKEETIGKYCYEVANAGYCQTEQCPLQFMKISKKREKIELHINGSNCEVLVDPIFDENDTIIGSVHILTDVTEQKKAEQALRLSESRFRHISSSISDISYSCKENDEGKFQLDWVIGAVEAITGYTVSEMLEKKCWGELVIQEDKPILSKHIFTLTPGNSGACQLRIRHKNGELIWIEVSAECVYITETKEKYLYGGIVDISEKKKIESTMIQSEMLLALGEMSAGMAHEINQPLNTLSIALDNMLLEARTSHSLNEEYLVSKSEKIFNNIFRIKNIIDHVRDFSRKQDPVYHSLFYIHNSIKDALSMVNEQFKKAGIAVETRFDEHVPMIEGNTYKFEQVILNLLINAKDALLEKKNRQEHPNPMSIHIKTQFNKLRILITVEDNGCGIKEKDLDKVFQPFYTTKETGKGTGLGLSVSYGLIQELKGRIEISSKVMSGTIVTITLPVSKKSLEKPVFDVQI